jgi:murein L,D-transpeptidase YafK
LLAKGSKLLMHARKDVTETSRRRRGAALAVSALAVAAALAGLGGCSLPLDDIGAVLKTGTIRASTLQRMASLNMDRAAPILLRIYKTESTLEVWKQDRDGRYALLESYPICKFSGKLGPKISEGDRQAPEGFYEITPAQMNPLSREYLAFNIGFPNAFDRSLKRTGSVVMVHGGCHSIGCYAMTDRHMDEIYALIGEAFNGGQDKVQLQAFPFRMTAENLAAHADNNPHAAFWAMLKDGSDAFLKEGKPPTVAVCGHRYVFNPATGVTDLDPSAPCPPGVGPDLVAEDAQAAKSNLTTASTADPAPVQRKTLTAHRRMLRVASVQKRVRLPPKAHTRHWQRVRVAAVDGQLPRRVSTPATPAPTSELFFRPR